MKKCVISVVIPGLVNLILVSSIVGITDHLSKHILYWIGIPSLDLLVQGLIDIHCKSKIRNFRYCCICWNPLMFLQGVVHTFKSVELKSWYCNQNMIYIWVMKFFSTTKGNNGKNNPNFQCIIISLNFMASDTHRKMCGTKNQCGIFNRKLSFFLPP